MRKNKCDLYKISNPDRDIDSVVVEYGGFTDYYNHLVDSKINKKNETIKKKRIDLNPRSEKLSFGPV